MTDRFRYHSLTLQSNHEAPGAAGAWLRDVGTRHGLSEEHLFNLHLCAEELVTNIASYAYGGAAGEIRLELTLDQDMVTVTVIDAGPHFDPLAQAAPPLPASLEIAPCGGLGLHLVRQFADEVLYERSAGHNRLTVRIGGSSSHPRQQERRRLEESRFPLARSDDTRIEKNQRGEADRRALGFISRTAIFRDVPYRDVKDIVARCELRTCVAGEVLFRAGERHRCVLVTIEGRLEVHLDSPDSQFYFEVGPGECLGEMSVADGKPNSAWVVAATSGRILMISEAVFLGQMLSVPAIARNLIVVLSERVRRSSEQVVARLRATLELESLQRELDVARQIQSSMLPATPLFPAEVGIEGRGFMRAARHVGGDFYDAFPIGDGRLFIAIGDVCSKGMPAALFMVRTLTLMRSEALRPLKDAERHLARLAARCNDQLSEANGAQQFVTMFCAIVDIRRGRLHFVNIGHNPPLIFLPGTSPVFIDGPRNPLAGMVPGLEYIVGSRDFPAGSLLLLYTDGVTEADQGNGELFGDEALRLLLTNDDAVSADFCVESIVAAVDAFADGRLQSDDITLLAIRRP